MPNLETKAGPGRLSVSRRLLYAAEPNQLVSVDVGMGLVPLEP
ncbi:UNVERIFIED_ORG: hypothetical protein ABIB52_004599 [Arthrobacter sp. UYCu721]